jgi:hypothetical protein
LFLNKKNIIFDDLTCSEDTFLIIEFSLNYDLVITALSHFVFFLFSVKMYNSTKPPINSTISPTLSPSATIVTLSTASPTATVTTTTTNLNSEKEPIKKKPPVERHKDSDEEIDVIGELIGEYGKWQFMMTFLLSLFQVPNTFHIYSPTFQVRMFGFCLVTAQYS